jgi:8-oxo-dGTP diphosphatase
MRSTEEAVRPFIHVVAGVVIDAAGRMLIAQRPQGKHMAGGWEFPGGKLEPGEERLVGLARELREEIGISIELPRPLIRVRHVYPLREVLLDVWVVRLYCGRPRGLDGQALRWLSQHELEKVELLPADRPIVRALRLPEQLMCMVSTYYEMSDPQYWPPRVEPGAIKSGMILRGALCTDIGDGKSAIENGADFVAFRGPIGAAELSAFCASACAPVYAYGLSLQTAWSMGASGVNAIKY